MKLKIGETEYSALPTRGLENQPLKDVDRLIFCDPDVEPLLNLFRWFIYVANVETFVKSGHNLDKVVARAVVKSSWRFYPHHLVLATSQYKVQDMIMMFHQNPEMLYQSLNPWRKTGKDPVRNQRKLDVRRSNLREWREPINPQLAAETLAKRLSLDSPVQNLNPIQTIQAPELVTPDSSIFDPHIVELEEFHSEPDFTELSKKVVKRLNTEGQEL